METIKDIKRELMSISECASGAIRWNENCITTYPTISGKQLWSYFADLADRIEKAVTNCNQLEAREALEKISRVVWEKFRHTKEETEAYRLATEALTVPIRNCDAFSKAEVLEWLKDRSFSKEDTIEWLYAEKGVEV